MSNANEVESATQWDAMRAVRRFHADAFAAIHYTASRGKRYYSIHGQMARGKILASGDTEEQAWIKARAYVGRTTLSTD